MAQTFLPCDREQELLLPPSLCEWLPEDHLAWFVLDAVAELELEAFYASYRSDGWGAAAHDPEMMVALLVYAYAIGERSSRAIERRCREDVACRVVTANQVPDHATIARFRVRHETALGDLFGQVLSLCADAGLVSVGVVAVDGSKFAAPASDRAVRGYEQIAAEILEEAGRIDAAEDELHGPARGDELPEQLASREGRRAWLREAKRRLDRERAERAEPVPRERAERLRRCQRRLVEDWRAGRFANREYEAHYERGVLELNGPVIEAQFARRPPPSRRPADTPLTTAALEQLTRPISAALHPRRYALKNRERLNRLLLLIQLHVNGDDDVQAYAKTIRAWLEANGGRPVHRRRSIADPLGASSLR